MYKPPIVVLKNNMIELIETLSFKSPCDKPVNAISLIIVGKCLLYTFP